MKLNRAGLALGGIYIVYFAMLSGVACFAGDQVRMIFGALVALPAQLFLGLLQALPGDGDFLFSPASWLNSNYFYVPLSLILSYLLGWALSAIGRLLIWLFGSRLKRLDDRLVDYLDRRA